MSKITECWVVMLTDTDGNEHVPALTMPNGMSMPLFTTREDLLPQVVSTARDVVDQLPDTIQQMRVVKFATVEEVEVLYVKSEG